MLLFYCACFFGDFYIIGFVFVSVETKQAKNILHFLHKTSFLESIIMYNFKN